MTELVPGLGAEWVEAWPVQVLCGHFVLPTQGYQLCLCWVSFGRVLDLKALVEGVTDGLWAPCPPAWCPLTVLAGVPAVP